jgi:hypothetical protein
MTSSYATKVDILKTSIKATSIIRKNKLKLNEYQVERIKKLLADVISVSKGNKVTVSEGPYLIPDVSKVIVCTSIREMTNLYTGKTLKTERPCSGILAKINKLGVYCSDMFVATSVMTGIKMKTQSSCSSSVSMMNDYGAFCSGLFELSHAVSGVKIKTSRPCKIVLKSML